MIAVLLTFKPQPLGSQRVAAIGPRESTRPDGVSPVLFFDTPALFRGESAPAPIAPFDSLLLLRRHPAESFPVGPNAPALFRTHAPPLFIPPADRFFLLFTQVLPSVTQAAEAFAFLL